MNTQQLAGSLASVIANGGADSPVLLEHKGSGYIGELESVNHAQIGEANYTILLAEFPTAPKMPSMDDGAPRFTVDELPDDQAAPTGWVQVVDEETGQAIAFVPAADAARTWQALVAEERRSQR